MNQLRNWLHEHDLPKYEKQNDDLIKDSSLNEVGGKLCQRLEATQENVKEINLNSGSRQINQSFQVPDSAPGHFESKLRDALLHITPLEPGDCLGCKLVGTGVMAMSGVIVLSSALVGTQRNPKMLGWRRGFYVALCGTLFLGFETAAVCRFMDIGPFKKSDSEIVMVKDN